MALGNFINAAKTEAGYLLNPKNYNSSPVQVAKEAYAPSLNKMKNTANSAMEFAIDFVSLSAEAKHELQDRGAKGWKAKSF